jgi:hypothetical protein
VKVFVPRTPSGGSSQVRNRGGIGHLLRFGQTGTAATRCNCREIAVVRERREPETTARNLGLIRVAGERPRESFLSANQIDEEFIRWADK